MDKVFFDPLAKVLRSFRTWATSCGLANGVHLSIVVRFSIYVQRLFSMSEDLKFTVARNSRSKQLNTKGTNHTKDEP